MFISKKQLNFILDEIEYLKKKCCENVVPVKEVIDLSTSFDFKSADAFSIERDRNGQTIIGYIDSLNDKVEFWYAYTTNDIHIDLVNKFNNYIEEKNERLS